MAHVPALTPDQMARAIAKLKGLPLDAEAKKRIALMLNEAAQGAARHGADRLDSGRREDRKATARAVRAQFDGILSRAAAGLAAIDDAEWEEMINEANRE